MLSPRDYTKQENLIADQLSEFGLRYDQQVPINQYTADFYVPELGMVIEADGVYGHLRKRDMYRDSEIMRVFGIENSILEACFNLYRKTHYLVVNFNSKKIICNS